MGRTGVPLAARLGRGVVGYGEEAVSRETFVTVGDRLPEIDLPDLDGVETSLSAHLGSKFLIFMWASW